MKVLHVSYRDNNAGAAIAASRLHQAMLERGVDSNLFCVQCSGDVRKSCSGSRSFGRAMNSLKQLASYKLMSFFGLRGSLNLFPSGLVRRINKMNIDVVNLHWVNCEMLSVAEIGRIKHPVVWTLHDLWPILGSDHYPEDGDRRYIEGYEKKLFDLNAATWFRKRRKWKNFNPTIVCVGAWLAESVKKSVLFSDRSVSVIHNTLNSKVFKPIEQNEARRILNLPVDKKLILFGAMGGMTDSRKGFDLLMEALQSIQNKGKSSQFELVVFGRNDSNSEDIHSFKTHYLGQIYNDALSAVAYSAADVMCVPSRQETFGQTAAESMACGTPVVAFACSGLLDIVDDEVNGRLVSPFDTEAYGEAIIELLEDSEMKARCRAKALRICDGERITNSYIDLYASIAG